jgi:hypothetical protein
MVSTRFKALWDAVFYSPDFSCHALVTAFELSGVIRLTPVAMARGTV